MNISQMAMDLKLSYVKDNFQLAIDEARQTKMDYGFFLETLLKNEILRRGENGIIKRLKTAKFPIKKYLEDFDQNKYGSEFRSKFDELETLRFIDNKENIIMIGTPGAGKTHYAIGIGIKACLNGKSVLFVSVPNLIIELKEAMSQNQLNN